MIDQSIAMLFTGGYLLGIRPGIIPEQNVIVLKDNDNTKYYNVRGFNYILFSGVEYYRNIDGIPVHLKYRISFRPLKVYHNGELVYQDCFN